MQVSAHRIGDGPLIQPHMDRLMGDNINGPSLIKVPDWLPSPLGKYYLYFGHHDGRYIRLAFADELAGPWSMHEQGVLPLADSLFQGHIASPDVIVDHDARQLRLYYHGADQPTANNAPQFTRVALSDDGLTFTARADLLGRPYMRSFSYGGWHYAIAMPGIIYRSSNGLSDFEKGPSPFEQGMRHCAVLVRGHRLLVFYTRIGDCPERIVLAEIDLREDWPNWKPSPAVTILAPERDYEGGNLRLRPSVSGIARAPVRELRDPAVYEDSDAAYLLYSVAGEHGIALARLVFASA
ncbi:MAG: hypothetical protein AAGD43_09120 [Pseudomonadota bacterium]